MCQHDNDENGEHQRDLIVERVHGLGSATVSWILASTLPTWRSPDVGGLGFSWIMHQGEVFLSYIVSSRVNDCDMDEPWTERMTSMDRDYFTRNTETIPFRGNVIQLRIIPLFRYLTRLAHSPIRSAMQ